MQEKKCPRRAGRRGLSLTLIVNGGRGLSADALPRRVWWGPFQPGGRRVGDARDDAAGQPLIHECRLLKVGCLRARGMVSTTFAWRRYRAAQALP